MKELGYFRRCHICGAVTEGEESKDVQACQTCGKAWARFQYFDDKNTPIASDGYLRPKWIPGAWIPIQGLTAHWDNV